MEEKLSLWIETLSTEQLKKALLDCVSELIMTESVWLSDYRNIPYWDATGDNVDGTDIEEL